MWISLHPIIALFPDPIHLAQTTPLVFHLSLCCQITHLDCSPPPIWQCQAPHLRSHFPSFTLGPSISSVSTPSVFAAWSVGVNGGTACQVHAVFINTPDSLGLLCVTLACVTLAVCKGPFQMCKNYPQNKA